MNPRTTNADKFVGHEDRYQPDRIHEVEGDEEELEFDMDDGFAPAAPSKPGRGVVDDVVDGFKKQMDTNPNTGEYLPKKGRKKPPGLEESIRRIAKAKNVFLNGKRIK